MGKGKLNISTFLFLAFFIFGFASNSTALPKVGTSTVTSGQVPSASEWITMLNRAENWINTNYLNDANTPTIPNGDSLLVNGTIVIDTIRATGWFDLAAHTTPRATRTYRIGLPTRLLWALHVDTVLAAIVNFDSLLGTTIFGSTPIGRPSTNRTGVWGLPTFMWQSVHTDSFIGQNVTLDSLTVTSGIDSGSIDDAGVARVDLRADAVDSTIIRTASVAGTDLRADAVDSTTIRSASVAGSDLAGTLSGAKTWTGTNDHISVSAHGLGAATQTINAGYAGLIGRDFLWMSDGNIGVDFAANARYNAGWIRLKAGPASRISQLADGTTRIYWGTAGAAAGTPAFTETANFDTSANFTISGSVGTKATGTTWANPSDSRLKKNVTPFVDGLNVIMKIVPVNYTLNGKGGTPEGVTDVGVIAQDILRIAPYMVDTYKAKMEASDTTAMGKPILSDIYRFNSSPLIFMLINSVKELNDKNIKLKTTLDSLIVDHNQTKNKLKLLVPGF